MKIISILGSTGSIGTQTLDVIRNHKDKFDVFGLSHSQKTSPNSCVTVLLAKLLKFVASALMVLALTFIVNFVVYLLSYSEFFVFPQPRSNATTTVTFLTSSFSL